MKAFSAHFLIKLILLINYSYADGDAVKTFTFPDEFKFGAASAAYQVEGGWNEGGKTPSIWDTYTHNHPELIADGSNADVSADSYHLYQKDVEALKEIGFHHYRFSISWPRVLINGTIINPEGISYYNKLIDALLAENIEPVVTIFHWDLPQFIQDLGGFSNRLLIDYFRHYADVVYSHFGDRVKRWITFNEPFNFCTDGYGAGTMAPGVKQSGVADYLCAHNLLLSHAAAYHLYQEKYVKVQKGQVGISLNARFIYSKDETVEDNFIDRVMQYRFGWFMNPIYSKHGDYPQIMIEEIGKRSKAEERPWSRLPSFNDEERKSLIGTSDFLAFNYYTSRYAAPFTVTSSEFLFDNDVGAEYTVDDSWTRGKSSWLYNVPKGLEDILKWIKEKYDNPIVFITENGTSDDGEIEDSYRIEYLKSHLAAVARAIEQGCRVIGYTVWSIVDNYEWTRGFSEHFGIFAVDSEKERIPKASAKFIKEVIESRKIMME